MSHKRRSILITKFPFSSRFGGGEKHTFDLVAALTLRGYRTHFMGSCKVLCDEFKKRRYPVKKFWAGIEPVTPFAVVLFPFLAPFVFIGLVSMLVYYRTIKGVRILYCLSFTEKLLLPFIARILGIRVFFMEHRMIDRWLTKNPFRFLYAFQSIFSRVIVVSQALARQCEEIGVSKKRINVIYNGVQLDLFPWPRKQEKPSSAFIIGTVAGLEPGKGIAYLLKALVELKDEIPAIRAIIVGTGSERPKLVWLSQQLGLREKVQWVGFKRDAYKWYTYFDVFVLPSVKAESFGIVLVEAMASGVPVIATNLGGVPEVISDSKTGFLIPPGDAQALAEKILYAYHNRELISNITSAARQSVEATFRHDAMIRSFIKLFEERV